MIQTLLLHTAISNFFYKRAFFFLSLFYFSLVSLSANAQYTAQTCSGTSFSFTVPGAPNGTTYTWVAAPTISPAAGAITGGSAAAARASVSQTLTNTTASPATATYTVTPSNGAAFNLQVTVNPIPSLSSTLTPTAVCSGGLFSYTPSSATSGATFAWSRAVVNNINNAASNGSGNPNEALVNTSTAAVTVKYIYTTTANGCSNSQTVSVNINPTPSLTSTFTPAAICSGSSFNYQPAPASNSYTWNRVATVGINGGGISSGSGNPNEQLANSTLYPLTVNYNFVITDNATGCAGSQLIPVTVNPIANISSPQPDIITCGTNAFLLSPSNVPDGTTYTWSSPSISAGGSISGGAAVTVGQPYISQTLTNNLATAATATYTIVPNSNGCAGNPFTLNVTVNPGGTPIVLSNAPSSPVCSGTFIYAPTSSTNGVTYSWKRFTTSGILETGSSGNGNVTETLTDTTILPVTVNYLITMAAGGCLNTQVVSVIVNPVPALSSTQTPAAICSNTSFTYTPACSIPNTVFNWTRAVIPGISNAAASGTGNPNEILINSSTNPVTVSYVYTLIAPNGCTNVQTVTVVVNPSPILTSTATPAAVCSGSVFNYNPTSATAATTFSWVRNAQAFISNNTASGTGNPSETLVNTSINNVTVPYIYTLSANGCSNTQVVSVVINPTPAVTDQAATICTTNTFTVSPSGTPANTRYTWAAPVINPLAAITGGTAQGVSQTSISQALINGTSNNATAVYTVTPSANGCTGATFNVTVTVNPAPTLSSSATPPAVCSNSVFNYTPASSVPGTTFSWSRAQIAGIVNAAGSGVGDPNETLINNTTGTLSVNYIYALTTPGGCVNNQTVTVQVKPLPVLSSGTNPAAVCSGVIFNYTAQSVTAGTSFAWTRSQLAGISNNTGSGTTSIAENLVNTSISPITVPYVYVLTANGCSNTQVVSVIINPTPSVNNLSTTVCNNSGFSLTPSNVPAGTTYSWGVPTYSPLLSVSGGTAQAVQSIIGAGQVLVNATSNNATATYTVTPLAGSCTGSAFNVIVTVTPTLVLSSSATAPAICSNTQFSYTPTSATAGLSYSWTRALVPNITNPAASGSNSPDEVLINTSSASVTVAYNYTLSSAGGCTSTWPVTVQVKPTPALTTTLTPTAVCSGAAFSYVPQSTITGTTYAWSRPQTGSISNNAGSGTGSISETLVNTGVLAVTVLYNYTLSVNGCSNSQTVNAIINPTPSIANQQTITVCSGTNFISNPSNVPAGTTYTWVTPVINPLGSVSLASAQASPQSNISQLLNNITTSNATVTYTVTPSANGCTGTSFSVPVVVNPVPVLTSSLTPAAVCSNAVFNYTPVSNTTGSILAWTRSVVTGISNPASSGTGNPAETLINISAQPVSVFYSYLISTPNGCSNTQTVTVQINPTPVLSSTLSPTAICSGSAFSYTPLSATTGTTYAWTRSVTASISNAAAFGTNNLSEVLVNTSLVPVYVSYNYTLTANGCSSVQVVTATVNPTPNAANQTAAGCSNTSFVVTPSNVPSGTQYSWALPSYNPAGSVTGGTAQSLQNNISDVLVNQTTGNVVATYTVTPVANGCLGIAFKVAVTVQPSPVVLNKVIAPVCSGTAFTYTPAGVPAGTTYTWSNAVQLPLNSLTGVSAQPNNQSSISQTLSSSNNLSDTAIYTVTPVSSNGCIGSDFTLTVPVNPVPVVNNFVDTICSGNTFSVSPSQVPVNTKYTWTTPVSVPFGRIIGGSSQNTGLPLISQTLTNTSTTAPGQLLYTVTPSASGCAGTTFTLVETVGAPLATITNKSAVICSGTAFDVTPVNVPSNTTYTWNIPILSPTGSIAGSSNATTPQTIVGQTISNLTNASATATYTVLPYNTGCYGNTFTATITVLPVPQATINGSSTICRYPLDTLSVSFVGAAPWSFNYTDNGVANTVTGITASPYQLLLPALPLNVTSRTIAITRAFDAACVDSIHTSTLVQKINPLPAGQVISLHGSYLCNNVVDTLFVSYTAADTLSFQWTLNGSAIPGIITDSVGTLSPGRYNAILTNQYGCVDTASTGVTLYYVPQPVLNFTYDSYCINNPIHFTNLTDTTFTGPINWLWDMGDSTTQTTYHTTDTYKAGGKRTLKITASQLYCAAYPPTILDSTINIEFPIAAVRMPSVSAYKSVITPLAARVFPGYKYLWTPTRGIDHPDSALVNFNYQNTQDYVINLITPAGCITYDSLLVRVFDNNLVDIMVPKSFTPNGDGVNDVLYPYLAGIKTFQYFKVYNRYGKIMFETTNPDAGWNGYVNGVPQPMSIYIWVAVGIANDGSRVEKKGETLLLR